MNKNIILFYLFILLSQLTHAKDIYVSAIGDNSNNGTSLADDAVADLYTAFTKAAHGDVIYVDGTAGVISHPTAFGMNKKLTVIGQNNAIIDAGGNSKFFNYTIKDVDGYLTIENIKFINANGSYEGAVQHGGGFLVNTTGTLTFRNCVFEGHTTTAKHGGAFFIQQGTVAFDSCEFHKNTLTGNFHGGAIYTEASLSVDLTISECLFTENSAEGNGGALGLIFKPNTDATYSYKVKNSTFYNNSVAKSGAAFNDVSTGDGSVEFENVTIFGNSTDGNAGNSGGLMLNSSTSTYLIENSIIYGNKTITNGGAFSDLSMKDDATITIKSTIFGAIVKNDMAIIEDAVNAKTSIDGKSLYGSIDGSSNADLPTLALTYDEVRGVVSFGADALPVNFADASLVTAQNADPELYIDQLGHVRRVTNNSFDAGAYQLDGSATVDEVLNDVTSPTDPSNISFSNVGETSFDVSWEASTDNVMFGHYEIQLNDETPIITTGLSYSFSGLELSTAYTVKVKAVDYRGNVSTVVEESQTTAGVITPVIPTALVASNVTSTTAEISWQSSEPSGLTYIVVEGENEYETSSLSFQLEDLEPATSYTVTVKSKNASDATSDPSIALVFTTSTYVPKTIYVKAGSDAGNDGLSAVSPVPTFISAYNKAEDGDVIEVDGTIVYDRSIGINKNLTVRGVNNATLDAQGALKFFNFSKSEENSYLNLENITFVGGNGSYEGASPEVGGAMLLNSSGVIKITGCTFEGNTATLNGGVIAIKKGTLEIYKSVFKDNYLISSEGSAVSGGVIHLQSTTNDVSLLVDQTVFKNNTSVTHGGVLNVQTNADNGFRFDISLTNSTFYENQTGSAGGVIFLGNTGVGTLNLTNVTMVNNRTLANDGNCAGIRSINADATVTINNSLLFNNLSSYVAGDNSGVVSDISTNNHPNFTVNHSIVSAVVASNTINGVNTLSGTVNGDNAPELTLLPINDDNIVSFSSDAIAVNHGSATYLTAKPTHGSYLVDQLDNVRAVKNGKVDCGAYQVGASSNIDLVLNDNEAPADLTAITVDELRFNSIDVSWNASTDNLEVIGYKVQLDEGSQIDVFGTSYKFEGLVAETAYAVKVIAVDIAGNTSNVYSQSVTTLEEPVSLPTPVVPTNLVVSAITQTEATVTWDDPSVEGLSFKVTLGDEEFETSEFSYTLEGLTANTDYSVSVISMNEGDEVSEASVETFTTLEEEPAEPKTLYVSASGNDENSGLDLGNAVASLTQAVALSNSNDKIIIDGVITHIGVATIENSLTIVGQNNATLDAGNTSKFIRFLDKTEGTFLKLENLTFINGNGANLSEFLPGSELGGAILINTIGTVDIKNCTLQNNTSTRGGGALAIQSGTVNIFSSSLISNKTLADEMFLPSGGAIAVNTNAGEVELNIYQTLIKDNVSANHGGAMIIESVNNLNRVLIQNSTIYNNGVDNAGGAIFVSGAEAGKLILENNTITKNYTLNNGGNSGGIRSVNLSHEIEINNSIVYGNLCNYGLESETISDLSFKVNVVAAVNSSIIGTLVESVNNSAFTGDGRTQYGTIDGTTVSNQPTLSLLDIDERGVVGFADDALAVGFANKALLTSSDESGLLVDQLGFVRSGMNNSVDCGAYQLDAQYDLETVLTDNAVPNSVSELALTEAGVTSLDVSWTAATDDIGVAFYELKVNDGASMFVGRETTSYTFEDLAAETSYTLKVIAHDYAGKQSTVVELTESTIAVPDNLPTPVVPTNLVVSAITQTEATVTWDDPSVEGLSFKVMLGDEEFETSEFSYTLEGLTANTDYSVSVISMNEGDEVSEASVETFTTLEEEPAEPKTLYVSASGNDENSGLDLENAVASLSHAVALSNSNDKIIVDGAITYTTAVTINKSLTIVGQNNATLDAGNNSKFIRFLDKTEGTFLKLENLTFLNGNGTYLTEEATVAELGGAILINTVGTVDINNCTLQGNTTTKGGAALAIQSGTLNIFSSSFVDNEALADGDFLSSGGAILVNSNQGEANVNIYQTLMKDNVAANHGGAMIIESVNNNNNVFIQNSTIYNNGVKNAGGALFVAGSDVGKLTLENSTITKNYTSNNHGNCGGIRSVNLSHKTIINNSIVYGNLSEYGSDTRESISDLSFKLEVVAEVNSSIIGALVEGGVNSAFTGDDRTQYGTIDGVLEVSNLPTLSLLEIDERGVVGFADDALAVGFAKNTLLTSSDESGLLVDQLGNVRSVKNGLIDCGAYQLDGQYDVATVLTDNTVPSTVSELALTEASVTSLDVSWTAATDDIGVAFYELKVNDGASMFVSGETTSYTFENLTAETSYTLTVIAHDYAGKQSTVTEITESTIALPNDLPTPVVPTNLVVSAITQTEATVTWDDPSVEGLSFKVMLGEEEYETSEFSYTLEGLTANTDYSVSVISTNEGDEVSEASVETFKTLAEVPAESKTLYVSADGNDENSGLDLENAVASLSQAVALSNSNDKIIVDGAITHTTAVTINKSLTIVGQNNATLDAGSNSKFIRYLDKTDGTFLKLENLTFINGNGTYLAGEEVVAELGGAILINTVGTVDIKNCTLQDNTTTKGGAALAIQSGTLNIFSSSLVGNEALADGDFLSSGGAILVNSNQNEANVNIYQTLIKDNVAANHGGAMIIESVNNNNNVFIQNSTIYNNGVANAGGALFVAGGDAGKLTLENSTITKNYTLNNTGNSAGIRSVNLAHETVINNSIVYNNISHYGTDTELMSDISFKLGVVAKANSSIIGTVVESANNVAFTGDGRTQYGTIAGVEVSNLPALSLLEIDENGVVGFEEDALAVGFANSALLTVSDESGFLVDQLGMVRLALNDVIDCGAYQSDGLYDVATLLSDKEMPTTVTALAIDSVEETTITASWTLATDNLEVGFYELKANDGASVFVDAETTSYTFSGLEAETSYTLKVITHDYAGNQSSVAELIGTTTQRPEGVFAPVSLENIVVTINSGREATVTWDNPEVEGLIYEVTLGDMMYETADLSYTFRGLTPETDYSVTVLSKNSLDEKSEESTPVAFTTPAYEARTLYVSANGDDTNNGLTLENAVITLNKALALSYNTDKIIIDGTIAHTKEAIINKSLTIEGQNNATIDAGDSTKIFSYTDGTEGTTLVVENLKFINANGKVDAINEEGEIERIAEVGGAISMNSVGEMKLINCSFEGNSSERPGGALSIHNGVVNVYRSSFINNRTVQVGEEAPNGGAVLVTSGTNDVFLNVYDSYFKENSSVAHGGAITLEVSVNKNNVFIQNSTIANNSTANAGGGIFVGNQGEGSLVLENVTMTHNSNASNAGNSGGIRVVNSTIKVEINNSIIAHNLSNAGTDKEVYSDVSLVENPNFVVNSSIITAVALGENIGTFTTDDNVLFGTVEGVVNTAMPELTLNEINENGVVTFESGSIPVGFAKSALLTGSQDHNLLVDQLGKVRAVKNGRIDCGAYQLDAPYDLATVLTDNAVPSTVSELALTETGIVSLSVSWTAATDDIGVAFYELHINDDTLTYVDNEVTSYTFEDLAADSTYALKVITHDYAGNQSSVAEISGTTLEIPDNLPTPLAPTNLVVSAITQTEATVTWDNPAVEGLSFKVILGDKEFETTEFSYTLEGLTANTDYEVSVLSLNLIDEESEATVQSFTTLEAEPVAGKTLYVSANGNDENSGLDLENALASLSQAVALSSSNDKIIVDGTITHTAAVTINKSLSIVGQNNAMLDAGDSSKFIRYLDKTEGTFLKLENLTFINGNGTYLAEDSTVSELGGAILINTVGTVDINNCTLQGNTSTKGGAALAIQSGIVNILSSTLVGNETLADGDFLPNGGAILVNSGAGDCQVNIYQTLIKDNVAANHGGAMIIESVKNSNNVFIQNSTIHNNGVTNAGGALFIAGSDVGKLTLENNTITKNYTLNNTGNSAGIRSVNLAHVTVINNSIVYGNMSNYGTDDELMSDISFKLDVVAEVNSSILGTVVESKNNALFTGDGRTQYGTIAGVTVSNLPTLSLSEIDERGVVGFEKGALAVGFANSTLLTATDESGLLVDQLGNVRSVKNNTIDCGAYQLDAQYDLPTVKSDNTAPSVVSELTLTEASFTTLSVSWTAAIDDIGLAFYELHVNDDTLMYVDNEATSYTFEDLTSETTYTLKVIAYDYAGNQSSVAEVSGTTLELPDNVPTPVTLTNLVVSAITQTEATVTWDDPSVEGLSFKVMLGDKEFETTEFSYTLEGLTANTAYEVSVLSFNIINEESEVVTQSFTTLAEDPSEPVEGKTLYVSADGNDENTGLDLENALASLSQAVALSNANDKVIIDGTINITSATLINKSLTIVGQNNAILDAGNNSKFIRFLDKSAGTFLKLENLTFINGNGTYLGEEGFVAELGGAMLINTVGTVDIKNCTLQGNTTTKGGAALAIQSGTVNILSSTLVGNETLADGDFLPSGGAILVNSGAGDCQVNIYQTLIKDNVAANHGGAMIIESVKNNNNVFIQNSTIYNNGVANAGGALFIAGSDAGKLILENNTITKNYTLNNTGNSAGIRSVNLAHETVINNSIVYGNMSNYGTDNELMSDISFKLDVVAEVNSSILGTVVESKNNALFTGDGRTQYGTIAGVTVSNLPTLSLLEIDDRGVVGFAEDALPVGFAKVDFYTRDENSEYMVDQLNSLRLSEEGRIDCGSYQLNAAINVDDLVNDVSAPTAPSNITFPVVSTNAITLAWEESSDDIALSHYLVSIDNEEPIIVVTAEYTFTGLEQLTKYQFSVQAVDYVGNTSDVVTAEQETDGLRVALVPTDVTVTDITGTTAKVSWSVEDARGLTYVVSLQGEWFETTETFLELTGLDMDREYSITVLSKNQLGDISEESEVVFFTTLPNDPISSISFDQIEIKTNPNPALNEMTVEVDLSTFDVEVYDLSGRKVYSLEGVHKTFKLDLNTGVYVLRILSDEHILTKRIVFN